jgi:hypothetical protein
MDTEGKVKLQAVHSVAEGNELDQTMLAAAPDRCGTKTAVASSEKEGVRWP